MNDNTSSWISLVFTSPKVIVFGLACIVLPMPILGLSEYFGMNEKQVLTEARKIVQTVDDINVVNPKKNNRLIFLTGPARAKDTVEDPEFGMTVDGLKMYRWVSMYQWNEEDEGEYEKDWSDELIDSSEFEDPAGHTNPTEMPYEEKRFISEAEIGAYVMNEEQVGDLGMAEQVSLTDKTFAKLPADLQKRAVLHRDDFAAGYYISGLRDGEGDPQPPDPENPIIGDIRVRFTYLPESEVGVLARQVGNGFGEHKTPSGEIYRAYTGTYTVDQMFDEADQMVRIVIWVVRVGSFLSVCVGCFLFYNPVLNASDAFNLKLSDHVFFGSTFRVALVLATIVSALTVGFTWLFVWPLGGACLLGGALGVGILLLVLFTVLSRDAGNETQPYAAGLYEPGSPDNQQGSGSHLSS